MFKTGIVSVTFRKLTSENIISLAAGASLNGIEWGGDIHVPHGDMDTALDVKFLTDEASLDCLSYGSYYKMTGSANEWSDVLMCAESLFVPNVRVWAGNKGSADTSAAERDRIIAEAQMLADMLADEGESAISFEFHSGTLTDTPESAVELMKRIERDNVKLYWQPNQFRTHEENLRGLDLVVPYLSNVHVFAWEGHEKFPLEHHRQRWIEYLDKIKLHDEKSNSALIMEFVKDDSPEQFKRDAEELHNIIRAVG
jgi:Xylose isomerase-like TIM barrel.